MAIVASIGVLIWVLLAALVYAAVVAGARADDLWASLAREADDDQRKRTQLKRAHRAQRGQFRPVRVRQVRHARAPYRDQVSA